MFLRTGKTPSSTSRSTPDSKKLLLLPRKRRQMIRTKKVKKNRRKEVMKMLKRQPQKKLTQLLLAWINMTPTHSSSMEMMLTTRDGKTSQLLSLET